ncbi:GNAT family N-acetyltransferase [Fischerella thermalis]|uniref:GNAT family N-acetyltransferase n=1 Tax=Fischerella thermalis TaxID=372787 RepID=UPI00215542BF|nr:GNAT family N-acetyltransferase [Fischerella thermalis]
MPEIETARLRLRPYTLDDLDETAVILSNPEVMKYSPRGTIPQDKVLNFLVRAGFKPAPSALCGPPTNSRFGERICGEPLLPSAFLR